MRLDWLLYNLVNYFSVGKWGVSKEVSMGWLLIKAQKSAPRTQPNAVR
jgi:hypothetical protein